MNGVLFSLVSTCLILAPAPARAGMRPVPVDVVMADGDLFFVLEEPKEIQSVSLTLQLDPMEVLAESKKSGGRRNLTLWIAEPAVEPGGKEPEYPKLAQIRYALKAPGLVSTAGPARLERNVPYKVRIEISGREFASEIFYINDEGKAVVPDPTFSRQAGRTYSVSKDKDGNKVLIPKK